MSVNGNRESPSKISINTTRLSAMMNSLENLNDANIISNVPNTPTNAFMEEHLTKDGETDTFDTPKSSVTHRSPERYSQFSPADTRHSMFSNYSGVIQEGTTVSYVVKNNGTSLLNDRENSSSIPSDKTLDTDELKDPSHSIRQDESIDDATTQSGHKKQTSNNIIIETIPNAKPVSRYNTLGSGYNTTQPIGASAPGIAQEEAYHHVSNDTLKLSVDKQDKLKKNLSIGSGNLASESGSSAYYSNQNHLDEALTTDPVIPEHLHDSELSSMVSSDIPQLETFQTNATKPLTPNRSDIQTYSPTVPQRNRNRPATRSFLDNELDKIEQELRSEMETDPHHEFGSTPSSVTKGESYFSAASETPEEASDELYRNRELPDQPDHKLFTPKTNNYQNTTIRGTRPHVVNISNDNDEYEDIDEYPARSKAKNTGAPRESYSRNPNKSKDQKHRSTNSANSFDVNTLTQLLMMTKGTLVGSEFANLGMNVEEKKALERLVDSLSRLTADMILDPERYQEGLKRLNNAVKALDGF